MTHHISGICYYDTIPAYREKDTFGDMDIIYTTWNNEPIDVEFFEAAFVPKEIIRNFNVTSLEYKEFQIDFIHSPQDEYEYALSYFSYNDCGNLVGKLARRFGLKHGHNGLVLPLKDGDNMFGSITLTLDHNRTLKFLGLDVEQFSAGFDNLDQIFEFIAASPNYNPDDYKLENVSHYGRTRDKKRDTYQKFLVFGENWKGNRIPKVEDKIVFLVNIFKSFPDAYPEYKQKMFDLATQKFISKKFNGALVGEWTGLTHKDFGAFMKMLRGGFYFLPETIVYLSEDQLKARVMEFFKLYEHQKNFQLNSLSTTGKL